jgi:hypothetical protein
VLPSERFDPAVAAAHAHIGVEIVRCKVQCIRRTCAPRKSAR